MAAQAHMFKRVVLGLEPSAPEQTTRLAAELAELLHLELLGLFFEDPGLRNLASFPFAREFRLLGGGWHSIELDRFSNELEFAIRNAERLFANAAKDLKTRCQFEVIREAVAQAIDSISRSGDIIVIAEPATVGRVAQHFSWLLNAAFHSAAAVMLVPTQVARARGPVVAIAVDPADPSIGAAASIAIAANEDLIVVRAHEPESDDPEICKLAAETGLTIKHVFTGKVPSLFELAAFADAFHRVQERLVVATRNVLAPERALSIASSRRVPVLVVVQNEIVPMAPRD
jgi:hypothetical protein